MTSNIPYKQQIASIYKDVNKIKNIKTNIELNHVDKQLIEHLFKTEISKQFEKDVISLQKTVSGVKNDVSSKLKEFEDLYENHAKKIEKARDKITSRGNGYNVAVGLINVFNSMLWTVVPLALIWSCIAITTSFLKYGGIDNSINNFIITTGSVVVIIMVLIVTFKVLKWLMDTAYRRR